jgi:hypothetical protein
MPASLNPTLPFASFITHAQILMPTMHAEISRLAPLLSAVAKIMAFQSEICHWD